MPRIRWMYPPAYNERNICNEVILNDFCVNIDSFSLMPVVVVSAIGLIVKIIPYLFSYMFLKHYFHI